jgi:citrate/tricarballylate utilization protein
MAIGVHRFWTSISPGAVGPAARAEALHDALRLKYLDGGHGDGCPNADDAFTPWRRRAHHATAGGFALCFAATAVATIEHYAFGLPAPYPLLSLPVGLGTVGGVLLLVGSLGQLALNLRRDPMLGDPAQRSMDRGFIVLLALSAATGLVLLAGRDSGAMAVWLAAHLAAVMALFLTLPYGKAVHGTYRVAALLKWAVEKRLPNPVRAGSE